METLLMIFHDLPARNTEIDNLTHRGILHKLRLVGAWSQIPGGLIAGLALAYAIRRLVPSRRKH